MKVVVFFQVVHVHGLLHTKKKYFWPGEKAFKADTAFVQADKLPTSPTSTHHAKYGEVKYIDAMPDDVEYEQMPDMGVVIEHKEAMDQLAMERARESSLSMANTTFTPRSSLALTSSSSPTPKEKKYVSDSVASAVQDLIEKIQNFKETKIKQDFFKRQVGVAHQWQCQTFLTDFTKKLEHRQTIGKYKRSENRNKLNKLLDDFEREINRMRNGQDGDCHLARIATHDEVFDVLNDVRKSVTVFEVERKRRATFDVQANNAGRDMYLRDKEIQLVMAQGHCNRLDAMQALKDHNNDVVRAILVFKPNVQLPKKEDHREQWENWEFHDGHVSVDVPPRKFTTSENELINQSTTKVMKKQSSQLSSKIIWEAGEEHKQRWAAHEQVNQLVHDAEAVKVQPAREIVGDYEVYNKLGKGGFGSVDKVMRSANALERDFMSLKQKYQKETNLTINSKDELQDLITNLLANYYSQKHENQKVLATYREDLEKIENKIEYAMKDIPYVGRHQQQMAQHEANLLKSLNHPHIIQYVDSFNRGTFLYLVMELANGGDLYSYIRRRRKAKKQNKYWAISKVTNMFSQIIRAVKYLHAFETSPDENKDKKGILHRDLKPKNILVCREEGNKMPKLKIADFGLAKEMEEINDNTEQGCGTKLYRSPESLDEKKYSFPSDVWALGCILFEMCTFEILFAKWQDILIGDEIRTISGTMGASANSDRWHELSSVCSKILQRAPEDRPRCSDLITMMKKVEEADPNPRVSYCDQCGQGFEEGVLRCQACNHKLHVAVHSTVDRCSQCKAELAKNANFCHKCGFKVESKLTCPCCSRVVGELECFCRGCGGSLPTDLLNDDVAKVQFNFGHGKKNLQIVADPSATQGAVTVNHNEQGKIVRQYGVKQSYAIPMCDVELQRKLSSRRGTYPMLKSTDTKKIIVHVSRHLLKSFFEGEIFNNNTYPSVRRLLHLQPEKQTFDNTIRSFFAQSKNSRKKFDPQTSTVYPHVEKFLTPYIPCVGQTVQPKPSNHSVLRMASHHSEYSVHGHAMFSRAPSVHSHAVSKLNQPAHDTSPEDGQPSENNFSYNEDLKYSDRDTSDGGPESEALPQLTSEALPHSECKLPEARADVNGYKILDQLGDGGFGEVYKVQIENNVFAMKEMKLADAQYMQLAEQEAEMLKNLQNQHIIDFYDNFVFNDIFYIVMEFADGRDLGFMIKQRREGPNRKKRPFERLEIANCYAQVLSGVEYMHSQQVLHRDLKPDNIVLCNAENLEGAQFKIVDFGFSKKIESDVDFAKTRCGTKLYMSPECLRDEPYSFPTDVWALGIMLFELCKLKKPFTNVSPILQLKEVNSGNDQEGSGVPTISKSSKTDWTYWRDLSEICEKVLVYNPSKRPLVSELNGMVRDLKRKFHTRQNAIDLSPQKLMAPQDFAENGVADLDYRNESEVEGHSKIKFASNYSRQRLRSADSQLDAMNGGQDSIHVPRLRAQSEVHHEEIDYNSWFEVARANYLFGIKSFVAKPGMDINRKNQRGFTALHCVIFWSTRNNNDDNLDALKFLLEQKNIEINIQSNSGYTSLHWAVQNNRVAALKILLKQDRINSTLKDECDRTAIMCAHGKCKDILEQYENCHYYKSMNDLRASEENLAKLEDNRLTFDENTSYLNMNTEDFGCDLGCSMESPDGLACVSCRTS